MRKEMATTKQGMQGKVTILMKDNASDVNSITLEESTSPKPNEQNDLMVGSGDIVNQSEEKVEVANHAKEMPKALDATGTGLLGAPKVKRCSWRRTVIPGFCLLTLIITSILALVTYFGIQHRQSVLARAPVQRKKIMETKYINDGTTVDKPPVDYRGPNVTGPAEDPNNEQYRNPTIYPPKNCILPNYVSKNGGIYAESGGKSTRITLKGANWSGMETDHSIPFGIWDNLQNGTTVYEIVALLSRNNFNSVRIPVGIAQILSNTPPDKRFINTQTNSAIKVDTYMHLLQSLIKAFGYRQISVMIDLQKFDPSDPGAYWYSEAYPQEKVETAIQKLASALCGNDYWNVIGIDVKNEPYKCTWGDNNPKTDFRLGATALGNVVLQSCPNWLVYVQGIFGIHTIVIDNVTIYYGDWYGAGLQNASNYPISLNAPNKLVYAPHFYSASVFPQNYMYQSGKVGANSVYENYVEFSDSDLKKRIYKMMDVMFGYLASPTGSAVLFGEFGGLYTTDAHPKKTTRRVIDLTIDAIASSNKYAGGYVWAMNPESVWNYNPCDKYGDFTEGLFDSTWLTINKDYLSGLKRIDVGRSDVIPFPCYEK